jgi:hypothetical protein
MSEVEINATSTTSVDLNEFQMMKESGIKTTDNKE